MRVHKMKPHSSTVTNPNAISLTTVFKMKSCVTQRWTKYIEDLELIYGPLRFFDYSLMSALLVNYVTGRSS